MSSDLEITIEADTAPAKIALLEATLAALRLEADTERRQRIAYQAEVDRLSADPDSLAAALLRSEEAMDQLRAHCVHWHGSECMCDDEECPR